MHKQTKSETQAAAAVQAWELYQDGAFEALYESCRNAAQPELAELGMLAALELDRYPGKVDEPESLFTPLRLGMEAYQRGDYRNAAEFLGRWLLQKDFYSDLIFDRFFFAAASAERHELIEEVARKHLTKKATRGPAARGLFQSLYARSRYKECLALAEKSREDFMQSEYLQKIALANMQLGRFQEAEQILLPAYERLAGRPYRQRYDEVRAEYADSIRNIESLARKKDRSSSENLELGMALLFSQRYKEALKLFESLLNRAA
jgi:tetratricopeptide (TPR) repeat protein